MFNMVYFEPVPLFLCFLCASPAVKTLRLKFILSNAVFSGDTKFLHLPKSVNFTHMGHASEQI